MSERLFTAETEKFIQELLARQATGAMGIDPAYEPKRSTATETAYGWGKTSPMAKPEVDFDAMKRLNVLRIIQTTIRSPSGKIRVLQRE